VNLKDELIILNMNSRRSFIKKIGKGAALSSIAFSSSAVFASQFSSGKANQQKTIRIGIIGAENSHTADYGKLFNIDKKFPGIEVRYVWGETEKFARDAMEKGNIPEMVKDPNDMLGKIDALIVDHRHPKYHLEAAVPFVKAGIPTFIDKPFCYRVSEGKEFFALASKLGTPVTSYSSIAQSDATYDIKKQLESIGEITHVIRYGPSDLESIYGGIFFYGVHIIQPLMIMFGEDIKRVRITRNIKNATASLAFRNGMLATLIFKTLSNGWETFIETKNGIIELKSRVEESNPAKNYVDMVEMFRTGKEPIRHSSILSSIAVLEALEKSALSDNWEDVPSIV
jgi:predicted dehydrogenase